MDSTLPILAVMVSYLVVDLDDTIAPFFTSDLTSKITDRATAFYWRSRPSPFTHQMPEAQTINVVVVLPTEERVRLTIDSTSTQTVILKMLGELKRMY